MLRHPDLPSALACAASASLAQPSAAPRRVDPLDARAAVPPLEHRSALAAYRRLGVAEPADWREANDAVARIGGWRSYLREAAQPEPRKP